MNKRQLIDDIRQHNATAKPEFLVQFDEAALAEYLSHLEEKKQKRIKLNLPPRVQLSIPVRAAS
jgi:hypothetical protein